MPLPKRPRDPNQRAKMAVDMTTGEVPNDEAQVRGAGHRARQERQGQG